MRVDCEPWGAEVEIDGFWRSRSSWDSVDDDEMVFLNLSLMRSLHGLGGAEGWRFIKALVDVARKDWLAFAAAGQAGSGPRRPSSMAFGTDILRAFRAPARPRTTEAGAHGALVGRLGLAVIARACPEPSRLRGISPAEPMAASYGALFSFHTGVNGAYVLPGLEYHADLFAACAWLGILCRGRPARVPSAIADFIAATAAERFTPSASEAAAWAEAREEDPRLVLRIALEASGLDGVLTARSGPLPVVIWPTRAMRLSPGAVTAARVLLARFGGADHARNAPNDLRWPVAARASG